MKAPLILLIDETDVVREYARLALEESPARVVAVSRTGQALDLLVTAEQPVEAVVLDWGRSPAHGPQGLVELRRLRPELPVVVVSADPTARTRALARGAAAFVEKIPGRYGPELLAALRQLMTR